MKKHQLLLFSILIVSIALCGCGNGIPDMSETEETMITEYATHLLVKYSPVSDRALLNDMQLEAEIAKEAEEAERLRKTKEIEQAYVQAAEKGQMAVDDSLEGTDSSKQMVANIPQKSIPEFFEEENFAIDYESCLLCDSYPEGSSDDVFLAMDATTGNQLCVVKFTVKNLSSSDRELDMFGKQGRFSVRTEDGTVIPAQSTLLLDDLSSYVGTIPADGEQELVLVFEIPDSVSEIGSMDLIMRNQSGESMLTLE